MCITYYVYIQVRQQLEYKLKSEKRETRPFSLGWYYQTRLKEVGAGAGVPPFSPDWFNRD
jgi:hypothetical protein